MRDEYSPCLICGSSRHETIADIDRAGKSLQTILCRDCGFVFLHPMPHEKDLNDYYEHAYREEYKKVHKPKAKHVLRSGKCVLDRLRFLKSLPLPEKASVLDVGTGMGVFVYFGQKSGFRTIGLEPHCGYASYGNSVLKVEIQNKNLGEARVPDVSLDVVTMHHVLEHLWNPVTAMQQAREWLRDGGRLVIEVPNIMARYHSPGQQFHPAHLYYFSPWTLTAAAAKAGMIPESIRLLPATQHILAVFVKAPQSPTPVPEGSQENYRQTLAKLKQHSRLSHYLLRYPYVRPLRKVYQMLSETFWVAGAKDEKKILDDLFMREAEKSGITMAYL